MRLSDICKVKEVYSDTEANKLLDKKYEIIRILQTKKGSSNEETVRPMYILGKIQ